MPGGFYTFYPPSNATVVTSINGQSGDLTLVGGPGINVTTAGPVITISNTGVLSWNGATGVVNLLAGANITITDMGGGDFTIASTGGGGGGISTIGPFDSEAIPSADALTISGTSLIAQSASMTVPGMVNTMAQTFAGNKTFNGTITAANLSGTNTGDVTIGTANGLSLAGQVLSLGLASSTTTGALSSTDWNTFNSKGSVSSVALADDTGLFTITGSPVTTTGTLTLASLNSQAANTFFAAPNGSTGAPSFRAIVPADVPTLNQNTTGTAANITATSNSTLTTLSALSLPFSQVTGTVPVSQGGTGDTSFVVDQLIIGGSTTTGPLQQVTAGTSGQILMSNGAAAPTWVAPSSVLTSVNMRATANNAQNYTSGSTSTVIWQTVVFDTNSGYNTSTGIYTVPVNGVYQVSSSLLLSSNTTGATTDFFDYIILHNGTEYSVTTSAPERIVATNATQQCHIQDLVSCTAGDTLAIQVVSSTTNTYSQADPHSVNFCVLKVG